MYTCASLSAEQKKKYDNPKTVDNKNNISTVEEYEQKKIPSKKKMIENHGKIHGMP